MKNCSIKGLVFLALSMACVALGFEPRARAHDGDHGLVRERFEFPVTLSDGSPETVVGYYYHRRHLRGRVLQVLVHGATYSHAYWDVPPINGEPYSYAEHMARRGYGVLALDMLGAGESSRPDGDALDLAETVSSVHQVLGEVRAADDLFGEPSAVVLVGHSNGSVIAVATQASYHDADALVETGWKHTPTPLPVDPASLLPALANPYVLVPAAVRDFLFYFRPEVDPDVVAFADARLVSTLARGQFRDLMAVTADPSLDHVDQVTGPVYVQLGDHDLIAPADWAAAEPAFYAGTGDVTVETLSGMGHAFNTHLTHRQSWAGIDGWLRSRFGGDGDDE